MLEDDQPMQTNYDLLRTELQMIPFPLKELLVRNSSLSSVRLFFGGGGRYDRKTWQCQAPLSQLEVDMKSPPSITLAPKVMMASKKVWFREGVCVSKFPETNSSLLKYVYIYIYGWKTSLPFGMAHFQGRNVSF